MNPDLKEGLEKFLVWWLELEPKSQSRNADELRQAFLDELGERIDQFDFDQDWDTIFDDYREDKDS